MCIFKGKQTFFSLLHSVIWFFRSFQFGVDWLHCVILFFFGSQFEADWMDGTLSFGNLRNLICFDKTRQREYAAALDSCEAKASSNTEMLGCGRRNNGMGWWFNCEITILKIPALVMLHGCTTIVNANDTIPAANGRRMKTCSHKWSCLASWARPAACSVREFAIEYQGFSLYTRAWVWILFLVLSRHT